MKVVLFCGGFGMRIREFSESVPKPMVPIGYRPILWHVMKYYAHFGHKDFVLCLGWQANVIKHYFLKYDECVSNDFVLSNGGRDINLLSSDIDDWNITFVDTGHNASIGERLKAVEEHVAEEETFLANYTDGLSDVYLPEIIETHRANDAVATFLSVRPPRSFHVVSTDDLGQVSGLCDVRSCDLWINGGFFVLSNQIFDYIEPGEDLVAEPFQRIIQEQRLSTVQHNGYWGCMDTYKEKQTMDEMYNAGEMPWMIWNQHSATQRQPIRAK